MNDAGTALHRPSHHLWNVHVTVFGTRLMEAAIELSHVVAGLPQSTLQRRTDQASRAGH
jgi:hypothetical protein